MNKAYKIKRYLKKVGREVFLADGVWKSTPFYAVIEPRWKNDKTNFENIKTELGIVSADYFTYLGPFDHNIESISDEGYLTLDNQKYIFKKKECVKCGNEVQFYSGILRKVWGDDNVQS